jgi:phosphoglycolate phosphatase-like HAD superfamily hydrolase
MPDTRYTLGELAALPARHSSFVGVDSDGCVFDTMNVKQREHFHPLVIRFWGLEACAAEFKACAEFVNMYSKSRGSNRFPALLRTFELLHAHPGLRGRGAELPALDALRAYVSSGLPLGNPSLKAEAERTGDPELCRLLAWSLAINADIDARMRPVPPFPSARRALERMRALSDVIVVSQTPEEALVKEWQLHGIDGLVSFIAGQELGPKSEHLRLAASGKYAPDRVLLIGDATGDLAAAQRAGALFYPVVPGAEEESWRRFCDEAYDRFLAGSFAGSYADALTEAFLSALPDEPPWQG